MKLTDFVSTYPVGRIGVTAEGIECILPKGVTVTTMSKFGEWLVGPLMPAYTFGQKLRFNENTLPWLSVNTIVHECTHALQEQRMGWLSYRATYFWQSFLSMMKGGPVHIHEYHEMEAEGRYVGETISRITNAQTLRQLDVEVAIKKLMNW